MINKIFIKKLAIYKPNLYMYKYYIIFTNRKIAISKIKLNIKMKKRYFTNLYIIFRF